MRNTFQPRCSNHRMDGAETGRRPNRAPPADYAACFRGARGRPLDQALLDLTRGIGKLTLTREVLMGKCKGRRSTQSESTGAIEAMLGELGAARLHELTDRKRYSVGNRVRWVKQHLHRSS